MKNTSKLDLMSILEEVDIGIEVFQGVQEHGPIHTGNPYGGNTRMRDPEVNHTGDTTGEEQVVEENVFYQDVGRGIKNSVHLK